MKKFLVFLCVVALFASMCVVASAAETTENPEVYGLWIFNDKVYGHPDWTNESVNFTDEGGSSYVRMFLGSTDPSNSQLELIFYPTTASSPSVTAYRHDWKSGMYITIDFGYEPQSVSAGFYDWLTTNAVMQVCDGSSCPVTDADENGYCDDCGLYIMRSVAPEAPNNWPSAYPLPSTTYDSHTIIKDVSGTTYLYMVDGGTPTIKYLEPASTSGKYRLTFEFPGTYPDYMVFRYQLINGEWAYDSVGTMSSFTFGDPITFVYTDTDVLDASGNVFFPLPLWAEMGQVTQGEMVGLAQTTDGTILILVLCGVGLMALLMVLSLFGKRSLIFRS